MEILRQTDTNASDDASGRAFGLDGNLYVPVVIGLVVAIALFAAFTLLLRWNPLPAGLAAGIPLLLVVGWVALLRNGRPAGFDRDLAEYWMDRGHFGRAVEGETVARSHARAPEARFVDGMLVFGAPERGAVVAKGFLVEPPDLRGASVARLNAFQDQVRALLAGVGPGRRLQLVTTFDADFGRELQAYHDATLRMDDSVVRRVRNERLLRYLPRMRSHGLRREKLAVFLSIEVQASPGLLATRETLRSRDRAVLAELAGQFEEFRGTMQNAFGPETVIRPMDDEAHFRLIHSLLNPSVSRRGPQDPQPVFDPDGSLQENCFLGEGVGQPDGGFYHDGHWHAVLTLSRWPQRTRPGIAVHLTSLPFLEYAITVNVAPAVTKREIRREEQAAERLRGEYAESARPSLLVALRKKERKVEQLSGGFTRPFHVTYIIRVWAESKEVLRERVAAVQAAINAMDGAQYFECALPTTAKKLFFASWPGWTHSSYRHRDLYAEDSYLADLLPFSATFTGELDRAEALYDGGHLNLVGIATQAGGSPQHALVFGMTGAGKSEFIHDLFFQTAGFFGHTLIVDVGFSHKKLTEALGETPIVLHPDADLTLNYLDTRGLPLTQLHLSTAVALLARMAGVPDEPGELALRQAQLISYVQQLYTDCFTEWSRRSAANADKVRRFACAVARWRMRMPEGSTALDAFVDLRDRQKTGDDEALAFIAGLTEAEITRFCQEPATSRLVAQTACAFYTPEEQPTHGALVELLAYARLPEHAKEEIDRLATLLRAWTAEGQYGRLFDGVTNVSLDRKVAHFELSLIPEQNRELKAAAGLLISGISRQHIISLPRAVRKRALYEEVAKLLDVPGSEQIIAESYAQLRAYNCWSVSVVQQYARFRASRIRSAVVGNAKQFFLLRQSERNDMADLATDIGLPETAVEAIQRYPLPEQQAPEERFSSVCYFAPTAQPPRCGTIRHFQAKEGAHASAAAIA